MPHARNAEPEDKAHAVLALAEYCVRDDVSPQDCSDSDLRFMNQSAEILCKDLLVLRKQAAAQSTNAWRQVLDSAHSMRCVTIDRDTKDDKRQRMFRCDGCGRQEKWCGLAIDLAGGAESDRLCSDEWISGELTGVCAASDRWPGLFDTFEEGYRNALKHPERCDMGRFYLGKTCHRKAQLAFIANTWVQETLYNARQLLLEDGGEELREDKLYTVDDEAPREFIDRKDQLELCIADEKRGDMPDVMVDRGFWDNIDEHRLGLTDDEIRNKATDSLKTMGGDTLVPSGDQMSDDEEDDFVPSGDDSQEEEDELDGVEDADGDVSSHRRGKRHTGRSVGDEPNFGPAVDDGHGLRHMGPPKKRRRVIDEDSEDEHVVHAVLRAKPPRKRIDEPSRRSRRQQQLSPDEQVAAASEEQPPDDTSVVDAAEARDGDESDEDVVVSSLRNPNLPPPVPRTAAERRGAPPSAIEVARNMRIPYEGEQRLGSRQSVLLGLINVQKDLILKREHGLAAQVGAAVLTMQELLEIAERSRVGQ